MSQKRGILLFDVEWFRAALSRRMFPYPPARRPSPLGGWGAWRYVHSLSGFGLRSTPIQEVRACVLGGDYERID
jgi:hypothetical protein